MARLEIPSIVIPKGSRSPSRPDSPTSGTIAVPGGMPSLGSTRQGLGTGGGASETGIGNLSYPNVTEADMIDGGNANPSSSPPITTNTIHRPSPSSCCSQEKSETENKNFRNRTNTKVKLLVRSHAMRESTSPPREPQNGSPSSPRHSPQSIEGGSCGDVSPPPSGNDKKFTNNGNPSSNMSPTSIGSKLNNNESMLNSNLCPSQSPKQMRNTATSPTCRVPSRNGQSSPSQVHSPKNIIYPTNNNKPENNQQRSKNNAHNGGSNNIQKCNNCVKNNQNDRPGLLQTPASPTKNMVGQPLQHSPKSTNLDQSLANNHHNNKCERGNRPNTLNVCGGNQCSAQCGNTLFVNSNRSNSRHKLRHQNSSQGSYDSASPCLSRDSSTELYTDSTGIDLEQFIAETINRNQKDRTVLLKIERDLIEFAKDRQKASHKFPNMSSYNRMLVHRVAAYFGMEHNVDQSGLSVIVTRTKNMRIPDTRFKEHIRDDLMLSEEPRRSILKRDSNSFEDGFNFKSPDRLSGEYCRRSKSFEEREVEYERARRRIFKDNSGESADVNSWPYWSSSESSDASARYRLLHPSDYPVRQTRLMKGESFSGRESFRNGMPRPFVSKSFSFGGYSRGMLNRVDSVSSTHSAGPRLTKQDSGASMCSRLSPSSSGYKSQSQRSDATISPSPSPSPVAAMASCTGHTRESSQDSTSPETNEESCGQTVMWAVTSISSVPTGSIIIDPHTNRAYTNPDGSVYRFDPDNPPKFYTLDEDSKDIESPEPHSIRTTKHESKKRSKNTIVTTTTHTMTNSSTSPSLPVTPPPASLPTVSSNSTVPQTSNNSQQCQQQNLVKSTPTVQAQQCSPYAAYIPTSESYNGGVYGTAMGHNQSHQQAQQQQNTSHDIVFNQSPVYPNYTIPVPSLPMQHPHQQAPIQQVPEISDLSGYFMGMNIYDQRAGGDNQSTPPHSYPQGGTSVNHASQQHQIQGLQTSYWQPPPGTGAPPTNQLPVNEYVTDPQQQQQQQTMYFMPPTGTAISVGHNANDNRQSLLQQQPVQPHHQRFTTNYSFGAPTMTPANQQSSNYSYPVPYNSIPTVAPTAGDYTYQQPPSVHMLPTYYPTGQTPVQAPPVMYRVPTPPNTPTSNQMPGMPLMYVNSAGGYGPPTMMTAGTFGHQVGPNGTSPTSAYITPALVPNLAFRQNLPAMTGVRASTPGSSQRASRSPTPAHDIFGGGCGDRNAQTQPRYPLPMYQGVHIVQGDVRLMHPGVAATNPRLQYAPLPSPPVVQTCPRPYRPHSYSSNASGGGTPTSFDGRNPKIRKQRSKTTSLLPSGTRSNNYQNPSITSLSSNTPKDIREGDGDNHSSKSMK